MPEGPPIDDPRERGSLVHPQRLRDFVKLCADPVQTLEVAVKTPRPPRRGTPHAVAANAPNCWPQFITGMAGVSIRVGVINLGLHWLPHERVGG